MIVFSLLPAGIYQFAIAIEKGLWFARSPEVTGSAFIHAATWARLVPDLVFLGGAGLLLLFVVRAITRDVAPAAPIRGRSSAPSAGRHSRRSAAGRPVLGAPGRRNTTSTPR